MKNSILRLKDCLTQEKNYKAIKNWTTASSKIRLIHNRSASIFVGDGHVETLNRGGLSSEYGWTNTCY